MMIPDMTNVLPTIHGWPPMTMATLWLRASFAFRLLFHYSSEEVDNATDLRKLNSFWIYCGWRLRATAIRHRSATMCSSSIIEARNDLADPFIYGSRPMPIHW
jgi:hypothetical protein